MNAPLIHPLAAQKHGIAICQTCDGRGSIPNGHGMGGNDPDSWDIECRECEGDGHFACQVCGCTTLVEGYDCIVCEFVADLPDRLDRRAIADLTASFVVAVEERECVA